jgi:hypothetical protein
MGNRSEATFLTGWSTCLDGVTHEDHAVEVDLQSRWLAVESSAKKDLRRMDLAATEW